MDAEEREVDGASEELDREAVAWNSTRRVLSGWLD